MLTRSNTARIAILFHPKTSDGHPSESAFLLLQRRLGGEFRGLLHHHAPKEAIAFTQPQRVLAILG